MTRGVDVPLSSAELARYRDELVRLGRARPRNKPGILPWDALATRISTLTWDLKKYGLTPYCERWRIDESDLRSGRL